MKHVTRKILEDRLDQSLSLIVRKRDQWCVTCGSPDAPEAGHIFGRGARSTRWYPFNVFRQCHSCNMLHVTNKKPYFEWFIKTYGQDKFDDLSRMAHQPKKWTITELEELLKYYADYYRSIL